MLNILAVGAGGFIGSILRYLMSIRVNQIFPSLPLFCGTLAVNVTGSFIIGLLSGWVLKRPDLHPVWQAFLVAGILGGFTTFSMFSHETFSLLRHSRYALALGNVLLHVVLCLLATAAGFLLTRSVT